uniref:CAMK/CAMK2 protein kinase n=1 Tax=Salpingoeca rosetta (strain ATCC 50818 / BSB-021) TaxID=946362 RepID=UPI00077DEF89|nr:Chain A, CAMK/CAMK2 protein kinase [Salpingoeca rosetta]5IG1_B Chain B, CAMK/CAMK2 protein kinase [Salpingoeca rosetta]
GPHMETETSFFDLYDVDLKDKRSVIGKGAFSTVHRCVNKRTGEVCAVKVIALKSLRSSEINKIKREIGICSSLQHEHIVSMRRAFRDESHFYLVFEYVSGGELFDEIVTRKFYNEKDASACMHQILSALQHCHSKNIIHRDLKPENLLLASKDPNAPVKITDFGLAVIMEQGPTYFGFAGTPGYLSPEVIRRVPYDTAVDVWACGVILYILLVGYPPFWEEDHQKLYAQIKNCQYDFPSPEWDSVTTAAKELIKAMLEPNPKRRPTVQELLQHPWIARRDVPGSVHRQATLEELKKFNARRKLKGGVNAVIGVSKMMRTMQEATRALTLSAKSAAALEHHHHHH